MSDYEPGKMDTTEQEKTFAGFVKFSTYSVVAILIALIFLALIGA
ncbi:aa3-type cytochrome c oxidase subunit IV [Pseudaestuariivita rosea]|nr:aa3-type cytochrome c oxidase subunit IV [Pseudaestuariivita rosea]